VCGWAGHHLPEKFYTGTVMAVGRDRRRQSRTRKKNSYLGKMFLSRRI
jgi:hypothetical protein